MSSKREMKRADKRSSITVLVLGDEGVGKSSLISTFVSRYFSEVVPGIMTRVRLPPDRETNCITTIVDSQGGDAALVAAVAKSTQQQANPLSALLENTESSSSIEQVDSIVLVYDLDRVETFFRLENHWLPLLERCYGGKVPVIVAENKVDLYRPSSTAGMTDEQALARKRQQIVSLMQRFPFVRQCIKCSAKNLLRVDDIFLKAQQAVLYPFTPPLYDLETGRLTVECKRALTRIFRIYDKDHDGLLSDAELDRFQRETYHVAVFDRDFNAWKKVVTRNNPNPNEVVIQDGKFTLAGFLAIFDVFISQNRLDVVWQALRKFGYDDELYLHVPEDITAPLEDNKTDWKLSSSAKKFLAALFHQFDSDHDGILSDQDILNLFSILPPPSLPPWHPLRAVELFRDCFSVPKYVVSAASDSSSTLSPSIIVQSSSLSQSLSSSGISILSAGDSFPSVNISDAQGPLSFLQWMGLWHSISAISPGVTRAELFRLGHIEESKKRHHESRRRWKKYLAQAPPNVMSDTILKSKDIRVLVLGSHNSGKTALLNMLRGSFEASEHKATETRSTTVPETSTTYVKMKRKPSTSSGKGDDEEEFVVHLVFTDVPEAAAASQEEHYRQLTELFGSVASPKDRMCDLAMLVFDLMNPSSFEYVRDLETRLLTKETPRVYVGTKADLMQTAKATQSDDVASAVLDAAIAHCGSLDIEKPLLVSAEEPSAGVGREEALSHLSLCVLDEPGVNRVKSRPHEEQKRREAAKRRKMLWLGGIVTVGVVVAVGVGLLWGGGTSKPKDSKGGGLGWLRMFFGKPLSTEQAPSTA